MRTKDLLFWLIVFSIFVGSAANLFSQEQDNRVVVGYTYPRIKVTGDVRVQEFLLPFGDIDLDIIRKSDNRPMDKSTYNIKADSLRNINSNYSSDRIDSILNVSRYLSDITLYDDGRSAKEFSIGADKITRYGYSESDPLTIYIFNGKFSKIPIYDESNRTNYGTVFTKGVKDVGDAFKKKGSISPASIYDVFPTNNFVNPYLSAFGWEPLGIPLKYSAGMGLTFQFGTPYTGPMETDYISTSFRVFNLSAAVSSRLKETVLKYSSNDTAAVTPANLLANYNNIFSPNIGIEFGISIPFGNFFDISYFTTIDSGDVDPPVKVINTETGELMPNNVVRGEYTNFELRYPFQILQSSRAKAYFSKRFGELHFGISATHMVIGSSSFDMRMDYLFSSKVRNNQFLFEYLISNIGEGFAKNAFAIGPSVRLGTTNRNKFGFLVILINMRIKVGDFFSIR
ncbi:MAG TPA: hypothetical protein PKC91_04320 [Ignavibacteria bacterium]|nr:hypothetical protein [Ignavibacteria bacterium]